MKTTRYFEEQVLRKRTYLRRELCEAIVQHPAAMERQPDGRMRYWGYVPELDKWLRVIVEPDGAIHNAFPDRNFKGARP
jgi:hypothetical protein